jgi:hypothetical protein
VIKRKPATDEPDGVLQEAAHFFVAYSDVMNGAKEAEAH